MIQSVSPRSPLHDAHRMLFEASGLAQPFQRDGAGMDAAALSLEAVLGLSSPGPAVGVTMDSLQAAPEERHLTISEEDWDSLFVAVKTRLRQAVGERLGPSPAMPSHSIALAASLVQAVVLDCVDALDQLHAALKQERSRRPAAGEAAP